MNALSNRYTSVCYIQGCRGWESVGMAFPKFFSVGTYLFARVTLLEVLDFSFQVLRVASGAA